MLVLARLWPERIDVEAIALEQAGQRLDRATALIFAVSNTIPWLLLRG